MTRPAIHSTAVVEGPVECGADVVIGALSYLTGAITIGDGTRIGAHAIIGTDGEHRSKSPAGAVKIGARCVIREGVAIQRGTGERETTVGDDAFLLHGSHVAHDCVLGDGVTLSPNAVLGGHTRVHRGATVGIGAMTHQHTTIGAFSMIGMGAVVTGDVQPFTVVFGNPARCMRLNHRGIEAADLKPEDVELRNGFVTSPTGRADEYLAAFKADCRRSLVKA